MARIGPLSHNPNPALVKGYWYKVITFNSEFTFWMPYKLTKHKEKRYIALEFIGDDVYELEDIESVRLIK